MRVPIIYLVFASSCITQFTSAADVEYRLELADIVVRESAETTEPALIKFVDRSWLLQGIEESTMELPSPGQFNWQSKVTRFRYVPRWLDDVVWPRTREMLHKEPFDDQVYSFNIALLR